MSDNFIPQVTFGTNNIPNSFTDLSRKVDQILNLLQGSTQTFGQSSEPIIQSLLNIRNQSSFSFDPPLPFNNGFNHENSLSDEFQIVNPAFTHDQNQTMNLLNDIRARIGGSINEEPLSVSINRLHSSSGIQNTFDNNPIDLNQLNNIENQVQQLHNATIQLVGQANDNSRLIYGIGTKIQALDSLHEAINNANILLNQTSHTHRNDIDQLIKENMLLRENLENLISALKTSTLKRQ